MTLHTSTELLKLLKTTKGKTFTTMACSDILVEIVKADIIYTLTKLVAENSNITWCAYLKDWGIHIECNDY
jgi:uncharacterized protein YijF (DUF1287 family)